MLIAGSAACRGRTYDRATTVLTDFVTVIQRRHAKRVSETADTGRESLRCARVWNCSSSARAIASFNFAGTNQRIDSWAPMPMPSLASRGRNCPTAERKCSNCSYHQLLARVAASIHGDRSIGQRGSLDFSARPHRCTTSSFEGCVWYSTNGSNE